MAFPGGPGGFQEVREDYRKNSADPGSGGELFVPSTGCLGVVQNVASLFWLLGKRFPMFQTADSYSACRRHTVGQLIMSCGWTSEGFRIISMLATAKKPH